MATTKVSFKDIVGAANNQAHDMALSLARVVVFGQASNAARRMQVRVIQVQVWAERRLMKQQTKRRAP